MGFLEDIGSGFQSLGNVIGGGFSSGLNFATSGGATVGNTIAGGAVVALHAASGGFAHVVDFTKTSAATTAEWSASAAGDVRDFSIEAYEEARKQAPKILELLAGLFLSSPPQLGPPDPIARLVVMAVFTPSVVSSWERDAVSKGYTMAIAFRGSVTCTPIAATAFTGVYVDDTGQWGFFAEAGVGGSTALKPNVGLHVDLWMIFGGRDKYASKYLMPGLVVSIPLPEGGAINVGGNAVMTEGFAFMGFRATTGFSLIGSGTPVAPDTGPTQTTLVNATLAKRAPNYDAALRAARNPMLEGSTVAAATRASLPFVAKPGASYYIQCKASGKVLDIPGGNLDRDIVQFTWTGGTTQRFRFEDAGNNSFYIVPQIAPGKALDVRGASQSQAATILSYNRHGGDNQKFQIALAKNGWYYLIARHSGQALDVAGGSQADLAAILQYGWHGGENQQFRFIEAIDQDKWRFCKRCSHIFYTGTKPGACPAGGVHDPSSSSPYGMFIAPVGIDGMPQDCWRWCKNCAVLSHGGGVGKCCAAGGGPHDTALTSNYVVRHVHVPLPYNAQSNWRWCTRCQGLVYGGFAGVCAAGGAHVVGTTDYLLPVG